MGGRSRAKIRDDITSLMHVIYCAKRHCMFIRVQHVLVSYPAMAAAVYYVECVLDMQHECTSLKHLG